MSLEKMEFVKVIGQLDQLDDVIKCCHKDGNFQAEQAMQYVSTIKGFLPLNEENPYASYLQKLTDMGTASEITFENADDSSLDMDINDIYNYVNNIQATLGGLQSQRSELQEQISACEKSISELEHFTGLGIKLDEVFSCQFVKVRFGRLPKESYEKLESYKDNPYVFFMPCSSDEVGYWGVYFSPREVSQEVDRIFASLYFERLIIPNMADTPEKSIADLKKLIKQTQSDIEDLTHQIKDFWESELNTIQMVYTRLTRLHDIFELRRYACKYGSGFYYIGWVTKKGKRALSSRLKKINGIDFKIEHPDSTDKTTPPVALKNNRFFKPFEFFVEMYGMPTYGEIDPTPFVAITYILLFGIMFGDLGQGLVLSLIGLFMWRLKKMELGRIVFRCGFCSAFFGLLYGSVFGFEHALDPFYRMLGFEEKPFEVMASNNINSILIASIGVGVLLVIVSMGINVYSSIKQKHWGSAFFSQNGLAGIIFYASVIYMALSLLFLGGSLNIWMILGLIVLPLLVMFFQEPLSKLVEGDPNWKPESIGDFILQNLFELLEYILSYISNTVSFLRVGAFVLVHAGMMMVVFALASSSNVIINAIIIIFGNALVIALEGLLTGIQVLRLEFYEMFSRYFEGAGRKFEPKKIS